MSAPAYSPYGDWSKTLDAIEGRLRVLALAGTPAGADVRALPPLEPRTDGPPPPELANRLTSLLAEVQAVESRLRTRRANLDRERRYRLA